jgi:hypothetical protein
LGGIHAFAVWRAVVFPFRALEQESRDALCKRDYWGRKPSNHCAQNHIGFCGRSAESAVVSGEGAEAVTDVELFLLVCAGGFIIGFWLTDR